jgi:hypothetical protein
MIIRSKNIAENVDYEKILADMNPVEAMSFINDRFRKLRIMKSFNLDELEKV